MSLYMNIKLNCLLWFRLMMSDCQRVASRVMSWTNRGVRFCVVQSCRSACGVQVWSTGTVVDVTPRPIPGLAVLTPGSSLGSYIVPTDQHGSFVHTLSSLMRTREKLPSRSPIPNCSKPSMLNLEVLSS
jgi:hypothetical protein